MTISKNWCESLLGVVAELTMGQSPDSKYYTENESCLPFLQGCAEFGVRHPIPKINCSDPKKVAKVGSLLFSVRAPVGKLNVADREFIIGRGLAGIVATGIEQDYLEQYLVSQVDEFDNASQGSTFKAINSSELSKWPVVHPKCKDEQAKIAEILSKVDRAIEQTQGLIAKQQRIKTGLMQDLLTRGIDSSGNLRSEQTHKFKDSPLGKIPVEWNVGNILKFSSKVRQAILTGPFGTSLSNSDFVEEGVPVLKIGNVQAGFIDRSKLDFVTEQKAAELSRYKVCEGDLLFARSGATTGRNALADKHCEANLINYHIIRVALDSELCDTTFVYTMFNSVLVQKQVDQEKGKSTREGVNSATILSFDLLIPPLWEQQKIGETIRLIDKNDELSKSELGKLRRLKTGLMQDLLSGNKRVTNLLKKEPVAV